MPTRKSLAVWLALAVGLMLVMTTPVFAASQEKVLHSFNSNGKDGYFPTSRLISDADGNLYGTTQVGGTHCGIGCGTVFELTPTTKGKWDRRILHSFSGKDGANPFSALIFDSAGNLYSTTSQGGNLSGCGGVGCGVVFKLSPDANGKWTETVLHAFNEKNGAIPYASLVFDTAGNLYGTTGFGGDLEGQQCGGAKPQRHVPKGVPGCGVVFKLSPGTNGKWTIGLLHTFNGNDGALPYASLILDSGGGLYGTTSQGGTAGWGTVFRLTPAKDGRWTEKVLHNFDGPTDGGYPFASLLFDTSGTLYGTTAIGGAFRMGTVFELTPTTKGKWDRRILHSFSGKDGANPFSALIFDSAGNLYGTTSQGGNLSGCPGVGCGVVFKLSPDANGKWSETVLFKFHGKDGAYPSAGLILENAAGNLFGTTVNGGASGDGSVFELIP
jgi:uncharacterized repeat protein (TIGR03803 family)